ncbi:hypothetical protein [uncultured Fusobacterium sp.]|uniref:hypothetical protein n=1 Tax=uncultured Fusobacterium sp. TaxID=159267 RepID=UPI0015A6ECED|nr:hypothetical protein [uncultured Fusobacterium sp.]
MDKQEIIEKGLKIIYSNVRAGVELTDNKELEKYILYINQIFRKRMTYKLKTKTSFKESKIIITDKKLEPLELEAIEFFYNNQQLLKIAVEESLLHKTGWRKNFFIRSGLDKK